jgi:hypothetical protein
MSEEKEMPIACLFHPRVQAIKAYIVQDKEYDQMFKYGLCFSCVPKLKADAFKKALNARLTEVVNANVKKEKEGAKNEPR